MDCIVHFAKDAVIGKKFSNGCMQFSCPRKTILFFCEESPYRRNIIAKMENIVSKLSKRIRVSLDNPAQLVEPLDQFAEFLRTILLK